MTSAVLSWSLTLVLAAALVVGTWPFHGAMAAAPIGLGRRPHSPTPDRAPGLHLAVRQPGSADHAPAAPRRRFLASRDPLAKHRAVTGLRAQVRWWEKVRAALGLAAMVVFLGILLAVVLGVLFFGARLTVELIVG